MKWLIRIVCILAVFTLAFGKTRRLVLDLAADRFPILAEAAFFEKLRNPFGSEGAPVAAPTDVALPTNGDALDGSRTWTFADGSELDAVLFAANSTSAQLRVSESLGVGEVALENFAEEDQIRILSWVRSQGKDGTAGFPLDLKTHRWPRNWKMEESRNLQRVGDTETWRSENFEIANEAGVNQEALESITRICESVDGALKSLPLPLPVNWGRPSGETRRIVIEGEAPPEAPEGAAGYWNGQTGVVHIFSEHLIEPDLQLVVFEFDKPKKVQKYDSIVHEVTHQSTAALIYLDVPAWVPEGLAEYMSASQYAPAAYQFTNTHVLVRHHINKLLLGDRIAKDRKMHLAHLEKLMNRDIVEWNGIVGSDPVAGAIQYNESLLLLDYFCHRDHPEGIHFRRYLEGVLSGVPEPEARERHLLRGRSYRELEQEMTSLWQPLGLTLNFQERGELKAGDVTIDWAAEETRRAIASRRAMLEKKDGE